MKKILVITHGTFAEGIKESVNVIMGDNSMIDTLCVTVSSSPEEVKESIANYMNQVDANIPVLVLTDIPAGSTTACAAPMLAEYPMMHVISGLNLGMMLAFAMQAVEDGDIHENIRNILEDAKNTMLYINDVFSESNNA
ncbi:PTS sugar transporter subunit IIA [Anaerorhabdus furcosa]|uniref:PTS system, mannose-specific IIA component n=1 Tax=Anaerorhabdus furcosa TaxID=118967 RepID=A0A1T4K772_9FIRM|nr:PTS sugar transporter subunit IIA [Anaerorhabdus furcosa]SJZ38300.1 PTS system, mannose-specific IIA component [Anaerorhabdus furcosa]